MKSLIKILRKKLYQRVKFFLWIKLLHISFTSPIYASIEFKYLENEKIEVIIGANELNRIGLVGGEIIEVIGDENKYSLYWSSDWRNLFIKPKVEVGETIELSLIMPQGDVQDVRFNVGDTTAQTIFINLGSKLKFSLNMQLKHEIALMMKAMCDGEKGKYYVTNVKRTLKQNKQQFVIQNLAYKYRDLSGAVLSVKNLTSKSLDLLEFDFKNLFKNTIAINLGSSVIKPRAAVQVFIITRETRHD